MARSFVRKLYGTAAIAAAISMAIMPASAADLSMQSPVLQSVRSSSLAIGGNETMAGWGGRRHHHDRGGIDAGDVLAGVLIIGGIAAIASAASKSDRTSEPSEDYRYREPSYPDPDDRPDYRASNNYRDSGYSSGGIDNAVGLCTDQVERGDARVASVDNAARVADGWRISGQLASGGDFNCWIDNDGRIRDVDLGGVSLNDGAYPGLDNQWNDDAYARARAQAGYPSEYSGAPEDYDAAGG
ncbi:MAG TPA: hypothetical protein VL094_06615 [Sphingomonadaceae bacterium]|nr:hypothetical protein [Sphingomonadaceae bacterium]